MQVRSFRHSTQACPFPLSDVLVTRALRDEWRSTPVARASTLWRLCGGIAVFVLLFVFVGKPAQERQAQNAPSSRFRRVVGQLLLFCLLLLHGQCVCVCVQLCSCAVAVRARSPYILQAPRGGEGRVPFDCSRGRIFGDLRSLLGCARHLPRRVLGPSPSLPLPSPAPSPLPPDDLGLAHNDRSAQILMCSLECEFRKYLFL